MHFTEDATGERKGTEKEGEENRIYSTHQCLKCYASDMKVRADKQGAACVSEQGWYGERTATLFPRAVVGAVLSFAQHWMHAPGGKKMEEGEHNIKHSSVP